MRIQEQTYAPALEELRAGNKRGHWMWYVFPQLSGLGSSPMAQRYAIADLDEAKAYLAHPLLGARLRESAEALLDWAGKRSAAQILGTVDALKFASSMTLFEAAGGGDPFAAAIDAFYAGIRDQRTLSRL